ncbi:hypothetical protein GQ53DRAFT_793814 [Thozetella sp. PMI_491]|nr:hypothetical protein GQ53DRAFT_793814 [Thozetella sp. PMI_491]
MGESKARQARRWKQIGVFLSVGGLLDSKLQPSKPLEWLSHAPHPKELLNSLNLDEGQCADIFPSLTRDIHDTVGLGPFDLKPVDELGPLQVRLKNGQLYIINPKRTEPLPPEILDAQTATLHQIHRAVITSPTPLPDTIFAINVRDQAYGTAWSYSRPAFAAPSANMPPITRAFLMPHFSFWAWPLPFIGSFARAAAAIRNIEADLPFSMKDPRAVWRGTTRFHGSHNPHLRQNLLDATKGAKWADVEALRWEGAMKEGGSNDTAVNAMMIEDFCRYKYVLHTEGVTYSGRLQFLQTCNSVLLTPPLAWLQHTTHLIKPVFSYDLHSTAKEHKAWEPSSGVKNAWPIHYRPEQANTVFVAPDWSDLEDTIKWLEAHHDTAAGIARRQREMFIDRGYFGQGAEVCYWRALIRGWSKAVQIDPRDWKGKEEMRWELFSLGHATK